MYDSIAVFRQRMVDDVRSVARAGRYVGPSKLKRLFNWVLGFDVNSYFTVLTHLSLEPGYTLDYALSVASGPQIYARREHQPRCRDVTQVLARARGTPTPWLAGWSGNYAYLSRVQTDGSEDGFFQLIVLGIMGGQFYQFDHAGYNDSVIVCTHAALDALLSEHADFFPDRVYREAKAFDLVPRVEIGEDEAMVSVALFTAWGGLKRMSYTVRRAFPHQILSCGGRTLVEYDCDIRF